MNRHLAYLRYILCHKWFVFLECLKIGLLWRGIVHDWHKFLPDEWFPYAKYFFNLDGMPIKRQDETGYCKLANTGDVAFDFAQLLHRKRARHHWQWWILPENCGKFKVLPMSNAARREMIADWRGAGRAQGTPDIRKWYEANGDKMLLHPDTRAWIEEALR